MPHATSSKYSVQVCVEAPIEGRGEWDTWVVAASVTALALLIFILVWKIQRYNVMVQYVYNFVGLWKDIF